MALFQESYLKEHALQKIKNDSRYNKEITESDYDNIHKSLLQESSADFSSGKKRSFDIYISHNYPDKDLILGVIATFEKFKFSVYVDWDDDNGLDKFNVTTEKALLVKERMRSSKSLVYVTSANAFSSKWMPWELGFMDGLFGKVAILPITDEAQNSYSGAEYFGFYPYVSIERGLNTNQEFLWVTDQQNKNAYSKFSVWLNDGKLTLHRSA